MKKIFIIILLFVSVLYSNKVNSQEITLTYSGRDKTNSTINLKNNVEMHIHVTNTASTARDIVVEVTEILIPHKAPTFYACWNQCAYTDAPINLGAFTIGAGETNTTGFHVTYDPDGSTSPANATFHIYENGIPGTYVTLIMDTEHVGVNDVQKEKQFSIYPNPAIETITIKIDESLKGSVYRITDLLGKQIGYGVFERNTASVSLEDYSKGLYFVSIYTDNKLLETKKLIIK